MNGGLSARGLRRAYERGRGLARRISQANIDRMKQNVVAELRKDRAAKKNWRGSR